MRKIGMMILLVGFVVLFWILVGCGAEKKTTSLDIKKVTFVKYSGDTRTIEMYIFNSDYRVDKYIINPKGDSKFDLLDGELPTKDEYSVKQLEITEESWTDLVNVLSRVSFMELEEELPYDEVYDAPSYYIQVETVDAVHKSGGYNAGEGKDNSNERFKEVLDVLDDITKD